MSARVVVPKLFRQKDRWYVRVQVPKAMQERLGKKEYWVSLKTSDHQEAMRLAPAVVSEKRAIIAMTFNRLEGIRVTLSKFTAEQRESLFREAYSIHIGGHSNLISEYEQSPIKSLQAFADSREATVEDVVATLRISHGDHPSINIMMRSVAETNRIHAPEGTPGFNELRKICVESFIEAKRNQIALLRGHAVHANPNPEIVDLSTGQPRDFTALKVILARPEDEPESLSKLVEAFIENPNKSRSEKTKNSIRGSMDVVFDILGDSTQVDEITEADCERVRDLIMQLLPNFKKLPKLKNRPIE